MWRAVTSFGDSALLLPLITWIALTLLLTRRDRTQGLRWVMAAIACGGAVALSKLLFMGWGVGAELSGLNYTGFSGHTALSTLVWPALAGVLTRDAGRRVQVPAIVAGLLVATGVAVSRLVLKAHSVSEVVLGGVWGLITAAWFLRGLLRHAMTHQGTRSAGEAARRQVLILGAGVAGIALLFYGRVFPSQHMLEDIALWLSGRHELFMRRADLG